MKFGTAFKRGSNFLKLIAATRKFSKINSEVQDSKAQRYFIELLGISRGLPSKNDQFLTMDRDSQGLRKLLNNYLKPLSFDEVSELIDIAYGKPWGKVFKILDKSCKTASLGQVHFGKLEDGTDVAVKIQYPEIAMAVKAKMSFMGWLPKIGPMAKWGFEMGGYHLSLIHI